MKIRAASAKKFDKYEYKVYLATLKSSEYAALSEISKEWELESVEGERAIFKAVKRQSS